MESGESASAGNEQRAVSPVIGVILMVAITVILSGVVSSFVLDVGRDAHRPAPQASFTVTLDEDRNNLTLLHNGGDLLVADDTLVVVDNASNQSITFTSNDAGTFGAGDEILISTNATVALTGWGRARFTASGRPIRFEAGETLEIMLIDTDTQKVIFVTQVAA